MYSTYIIYAVIPLYTYVQKCFLRATASVQWYTYTYQVATALRDLLDGIIGAVRHHHKQMAGSRVDVAYILYLFGYMYTHMYIIHMDI